jgi:hypothetical protein
MILLSMINLFFWQLAPGEILCYFIILKIFEKILIFDNY